MAQYTQPVVGQQQQQQQSSPPQQHQQQQTQTTTPQAPNNTNNNNMNNNNNNNTNPAPTTPTAAAAPSGVAATTNNNNNQTQTIAVPQPVANAGNNNYATAQNVVPGVVGVAGAPVYNPQLQAANLYVPAAAHHGMPGHHHPQPGAMYSTMLPAPLSSNVFVNNVTANVNLHGWPHTAVPHGGWMHAAGAPHYIHGEIPPEQGGPVLQPMAMPIALQPTGQNMNTHSGGGGGGRGNRRGRGGRGGGSGSRRNDYNSQRHTPQQQQHHHHQQQQQHEGSPAPQGSSVQNTNQQSQEQQTIESQQIMSSIPYAPAHPHGPYAAAQYPYGYPAYFAPQQPMIHAGQNPAAQQAAGTSLFFSPMPVYNNPHIYNYGYFIPPVVNQAEYPYMPAEEVMAGQVVDERQGGGETSAMIWHQPHMYPGEEYAMNPNEMHSIGADDINQNSGSASETPTSMLSPNYTPIYDPQMHEMQQQMGVMQIYEDPQMGQMQVIHSQGGSAAAAAGGIGTQIEDDISECGSQRSAPIHIVPAGAIIASAPNMVAAPPALQQQHQPTNQISEQLPMHQQQPHLIPAAGSVISIDQTTSTNQQLPLSSDNNNVLVADGAGMQPGEYATNNAMQPCESITNLNEDIPQQQNIVENVGQDYQQQQHQQIQGVEISTAPMQMDNYNAKNNKILMTEVHALQDNVPKPTQIITTTSSVAVANVDVAIETLQQTIVQQQQQQQTSHTFVAATQTQSVPQQQQVQPQQPQNYKQQQPQSQQYQHQQLQTQPQPQQQQQQHHHQPQQQQQQSYNQHQQQTHYHNYDRKSYSSQQQQSRRNNKYDHHNDGSSQQQSQQQQQQQPTTKTMSWTNSSQHKKSTNTVAVTATPSLTHNPGYNKQSSSSTNSSSTSTHSHGTRTYTNQQHHSYQQQQQTTQTRNYGAMKMPSSPVASGTAATGPGATNSSTMERKSSQSSSGDHAGKTHQATTSTASTTATPHQFQQTASNESTNTAGAKQQRKSSAAQQQQQQQQGVASPNTTASTNPSGPVNETSTPPINLAPPASAAAQAAPSTPSWASLFTASAASSGPASSPAAVSTTNQNTSASNNNTLPSNSAATTTANYAQKPIAKVAPFESAVSTVTPVVTPGALSYSAASAQNLPPPPSSNATNSSAALATVAGGNRKITNLANLDEYSLKFADFLTKYKSDWTTISLRPRGLTNRSNYCYINSILQALLGCSPLYNLMRSIPKQAATLCEVKTPTVNAMMSFMSNFSNLPSGLRLRTAKGGKGSNNKDDLAQELQCDPAFEPTEIYKLWNDSREEHVEGRQEDAEEFLSYILNKLNDEMLEVVKLIAKPNPEQNGQNDQSEGEDGDVWQMICNNRNKGSVTRQTDFGCTPLSDIFRGELRSRLQREGEHPTDVIQPFLTLPLNIEKAASVKEALEILVGRDQLEGVTGSKSKQEVLAWQQMNVEKLPPILILHLKWFDYRSDGCTKILKKVEFPVDLKIDTKILASKKYSQKQRAYRLFAVVYHDGKEASKGHYITDVYHTGYGSWLRYDDSSVKSVSENHVLLPRTPRVPYLLYYRRCDTIPQQNNNNNSGGGGGNSSSGGNNASGGHNTPK